MPEDVQSPDQKQFFDFSDTVIERVKDVQRRTGSTDKAAAKVVAWLFEKTKGDATRVTPEIIDSTFDDVADEHRSLNDGK